MSLVLHGFKNGYTLERQKLLSRKNTSAVGSGSWNPGIGCKDVRLAQLTWHQPCLALSVPT